MFPRKVGVKTKSAAGPPQMQFQQKRHTNSAPKKPPEGEVSTEADVIMETNFDKETTRVGGKPFLPVRARERITASRSGRGKEE